MASEHHLALPLPSQSGRRSKPLAAISNPSSPIFPTSSSRDQNTEDTCRRCISSPQMPSPATSRYVMKQFCIFVILLALFCWWRSGRLEDFKDLKQAADSLTKKLLLPPELRGLHFVLASNPDIRYVGRWTQTPNRLRRDSHYAAAHLEFTVRNCSSVYISLHNSDLPNQTPEVAVLAGDTSEPSRLDFHSLSRKSTLSLSAPPVSLLSQVDGGRYTTLFQHGKGVLAITAADVSADEDHTIRITALDIGSQGQGVIEFEGAWISDGGFLIPPKQRTGHMSSDMVWMRNSTSSNSHTRSSDPELQAKAPPNNEHTQLDRRDLFASQPSRQRTLEIVSDVTRIVPGPFDSADIPALEGWENVVGEMFGIEHVKIALDGMCLVTPCIGGRAQPANIKDAFFRSGPPGTSSFARSWNFHTYIPDAMMLILGASDELSFRNHGDEYEKTMRELHRNFEENYVSFVQAIRKAAYPLHPAALDDYSSNGDGFVFNSAPATIPIFVVGPFTGEMSHSTAKVVEKLQAEGDKSVYWLDTSAWFSSQDFEPASGEVAAGRSLRYLNVRGNRKAAAFLQSHLCHHLAEDQAQCPFLNHEAYTGEAYVPSDAHLGKVMEEAKIEKVKSVFSAESMTLSP